MSCSDVMYQYYPYLYQTHRPPPPHPTHPHAAPHSHPHANPHAAHHSPARPAPFQPFPAATATHQYDRVNTRRKTRKEKEVSRKRQPLLLCRRIGVLLVRERGCVSARGGCIELQIARGQMDMSMDELAVACCDSRKKKRPWKSSDLADPVSYPRNLDSTRLFVL
ncbi:hypothetical protein EAG_08567 [Camponotus floridanus]|uniref:Uncharacterized protein n=1 Tax=Camponotus floridanus TaxID=104421 RepID=E1ZWW4_CAMFO|nr:hypothetical protein EAG_08567 [Camponotus floridanus]